VLVVLVPVNTVAEAILLAVYLCLLVVCEVAAIGLAIVSDLFVQVGFAVFQMPGLSGSERAALHALRDAVLLIHFTIVDKVIRIREARQEQARGKSCQECFSHGVALSFLFPWEALLKRFHSAKPINSAEVAASFR
jgi:hypothetical protein